MQLYFVTCEDIHDMTRNPGVKKKIIAQISALNRLSQSCEYYFLPQSVNGSLLAKAMRRLPWVNFHKHWHIDERLRTADGLYMRALGTLDSYIIKFLQSIKQHNPKVRMVWEIPTYPYDQELTHNLRGYPLYWKDLIARKKLRYVIDRIATLTDDKEIFDIPALHMQNGIDINEYTPRKSRPADDTIHCVAVSSCAWWHAYERFILGLKNYYVSGGKRRIVFHLVGDGAELPKYKKLVAENNLAEYVIFHGSKHGKELDDIYGIGSLGIGSLGSHRKGLSSAMPLKTREYLAKGIPFIMDVPVSDIADADAADLYLKVPSGESPIDMAEVLKFYDHIYSEPEEKVIERLHRYAKEHFAMEVAMKEVIDYFRSTER